MISLFHGSLEMQKFNFVTQLAELLENEEHFDQQYMNKHNQAKLKAIITDQDYLKPYHTQIKSGYKGTEYAKATQDYFKKQRRAS